MREKLKALRVAVWKLLLLKTWPVRRFFGSLLCMANRHLWEEAPALDKKGEFDTSKPGRYKRCKRPSCKVLKGRPALVQVGHWLESDDFMVLARLDCRRCFGRGYTGKMLMPHGAKAKVPCQCIRVQPAYVEWPVNKDVKEAEAASEPAVAANVAG